jgi:hypothetical protein
VEKEKGLGSSVLHPSSTQDLRSELVSEDLGNNSQEEVAPTTQTVLTEEFVRRGSFDGTSFPGFSFYPPLLFLKFFHE